MDTSQNIGLSEERLGRIAPAVRRHIGPEKLSGAVTLVARHGRIAHLESHGFAERETERPMAPDSIFRIYSMTKPITMVAVLTLFEQGVLRLTDPVSRFLPAFADLKVVRDEKSDRVELVDLERPVTIRHLLTHTAGLTYHYGENGVVEQMYRESQLFADDPLGTLVDHLATMPLAFQPGTQWRYSVAHDVAARVVEVATGMAFGEYLDLAIFRALRMGDTGFYVPAGKLDRLTAEYGLADIREPDMTSSTWSAVGVQDPVPHRLRRPGDGPESRPNELYRGGHGLVSTAEDYYRFCQMLLNGGRLDGRRILSRKTVELMTSNHLSTSQIPPDWADPGIGFGLGVRVSMDPAQSQMLGTVGEHGWSGAAGTYYWVDPQEQFIGIFMSQFQPGGYFPASADFRTAAYQAIDD